MDKKAEAIKRMKLLKIMPEIIKEFEDNGTLYVSERMSNIFPATLYWATNYEGLMDKVREFEKEHDSLVYHIQLTHLAFGDCFSFLCVSSYEDEWGMDIAGIKNGECLAYVYNASDPWCSEFGYIGIEPSMGGVSRTY